MHTYQHSIIGSRDCDVVMLPVGIVMPVVVDDLDSEAIIELEHETAVVLNRQLEKLVVLILRAFYVGLDLEQ